MGELLFITVAQKPRSCAGMTLSCFCIKSRTKYFRPRSNHPCRSTRMIATVTANLMSNNDCASTLSIFYFIYFSNDARPDMTYNVFSGTLNRAQPINLLMRWQNYLCRQRNPSDNRLANDTWSWCSRPQCEQSPCRAYYPSRTNEQHLHCAHTNIHLPLSFSLIRAQSVSTGYWYGIGLFLRV